MSVFGNVVHSRAGTAYYLAKMSHSINDVGRGKIIMWIPIYFRVDTRISPRQSKDTTVKDTFLYVKKKIQENISVISE